MAFEQVSTDTAVVGNVGPANVHSYFYCFFLQLFFFFLVSQKYLGLILMSKLQSTAMKFLIAWAVAFSFSIYRVLNESGKSVNCSASSDACSTFSYSAQKNEN